MDAHHAKREGDVQSHIAMVLRLRSGNAAPREIGYGGGSSKSQPMYNPLIIGGYFRFSGAFNSVFFFFFWNRKESDFGKGGRVWPSRVVDAQPVPVRALKTVGHEYDGQQHHLKIPKNRGSTEQSCTESWQPGNHIPLPHINT